MMNILKKVKYIRNLNPKYQLDKTERKHYTNVEMYYMNVDNVSMFFFCCCKNQYFLGQPPSDSNYNELQA